MDCRLLSPDGAAVCAVQSSQQACTGRLRSNLLPGHHMVHKPQTYTVPPGCPGTKRRKPTWACQPRKHESVALVDQGSQRSHALPVLDGQGVEGQQSKVLNHLERGQGNAVWAGGERRAGIERARSCRCNAVLHAGLPSLSHTPRPPASMPLAWPRLAQRLGQSLQPS